MSLSEIPENYLREILEKFLEKHWGVFPQNSKRYSGKIIAHSQTLPPSQIWLCPCKYKIMEILFFLNLEWIFRRNYIKNCSEVALIRDELIIKIPKRCCKRNSKRNYEKKTVKNSESDFEETSEKKIQICIIKIVQKSGKSSGTNLNRYSVNNPDRVSVRNRGRIPWTYSTWNSIKSCTYEIFGGILKRISRKSLKTTLFPECFRDHSISAQNAQLNIYCVEFLTLHFGMYEGTSRNVSSSFGREVILIKRIFKELSKEFLREISRVVAVFMVIF